MDLGYDPGPFDGIYGKRTEAALEALLAHRGASAPVQRPAPIGGTSSVPWVAEAMTVFKKHEVRDREFLIKYLRSDGKTLGDPSKLPWCGDLMETVIKNSLPDEPFHGPLGENPYWARNWAGFGVPCPAVFGAVAAFTRGTGGHVGTLVGEFGDRYLVLGGNQGDEVDVDPILKSRLIATRWPATFPFQNIALPKSRELAQKALSTNEA
jgi:hypothetical protein